MGWDGWIDVSLPLGPATPAYPGDPAVTIQPVCTLDDGPYHLSAVTLASHSGTHLDAPAHFVRGGLTLPQIPLERLNGPAWVLALPPTPCIEPADLEALWPASAAPERVLLQTRGAVPWAHPEAFDCPHPLSPEAADWLLARGVRLVGIDALSVETGAHGFPVHERLLGAGALLLEGLDLSQVPPGSCELLCLPLKLEAPDGAPVRALVRPAGTPGLP